MLDDIIIFLIYSFAASVLEHIAYLSSKQDKIVANFITGFPLYGIGAYLVIYINEFIKNSHLLIKFIVFTAVLTLLEYISGKIVGAGPDSYKENAVESWDYTYSSFNYQGIISLRSSLFFGLLALLVIKVHPILKSRVNCTN